jgi:hypothetical protein
VAGIVIYRRQCALPSRAHHSAGAALSGDGAAGSSSAMVPNVANIENGEISLAPKLGDT